MRKNDERPRNGFGQLTLGAGLLLLGLALWGCDSEGVCVGEMSNGVENCGGPDSESICTEIGGTFHEFSSEGGSALDQSRRTCQSLGFRECNTTATVSCIGAE